MHSELDSDAERRDRDWLLRDYSGVVSELAKVTVQRDEAIAERDKARTEAAKARKRVSGLESDVEAMQDEADIARAEAVKCKAERDQAQQEVERWKSHCEHTRKLTVELREAYARERDKALADLLANEMQHAATWREVQRLSNRALQITRTQARIGAWGDSCPAVRRENSEVLASIPSGAPKEAAIHAALAKLVEEVDELRGEYIDGEYIDREAFDRELADVAIVVFRLAYLRGCDLFDAIEAKMLANVAKHGGVWMDRDGKEHGNG